MVQKTLFNSPIEAFLPDPFLFGTNGPALSSLLLLCNLKQLPGPPKALPANQNLSVLKLKLDTLQTSVLELPGIYCISDQPFGIMSTVPEHAGSLDLN